MRWPRKLRALSDLYSGLYVTILKKNRLEILKLKERLGRAFDYYYSNTQSDQWLVSQCDYHPGDLNKNNVFANKITRAITINVKTIRIRKSGINEIYEYRLTQLFREIIYKENFVDLI